MSEQRSAPIRFLVCGMKGAGKSSAIGILLRKDPLETTPSVAGHYLGHVAHFPVECVETVGFNGGQRGDAMAMEAITKALQDGVDHVLVVMSVVSQCNAPERKFLRKIADVLRAVPDRVTLVITKADSPELFKTARSVMGPNVIQILATKHNFKISATPIVLSRVLIENAKHQKVIADRLVKLGTQIRPPTELKEATHAGKRSLDDAEEVQPAKRLKPDAAAKPGMMLQRLQDGTVQLQPATSELVQGSVLMHLTQLGERLSGSMDTTEYTHHLDDMRMIDDGPNGLPILTGRVIRRHRVTGEVTLMEASYSYNQDRTISGQLVALNRNA